MFKFRKLSYYLMSVAGVAGIVLLGLTWYHKPNPALTITISPQPTVNQADANIPHTIAAALRTLSQHTGGQIVLTNGDYIIQQSLVLSDNITITREGTVRIMAGEQLHDDLVSNQPPNVTNGSAVHDILLTNLTLIGNKNERHNCIQLVAGDANRNDSIKLQKITAQDCGRYGIHIKGANNIVLENINAANNGQNVGHDHNIYLLRVTGATLNTITTTGAAGNGLSSSQLKRATITNLRSESNGRRGLRIGGGKNITVQDCVIANNGVNLAHLADGVVITSDDNHHASSNILFDNCSIIDNQHFGVYLRSANHITIQNSIIKGQSAGDLITHKSTLTTDQLNPDCTINEL